MTDQVGNQAAESRHLPYGAERWSWTGEGAFPTDYRWTGQPLAAGLGVYQMGARWVDPALSRWLSADTLVPGTAASSGGGAATLGYDDQVRLTPLTVGFHETQFLSVVGEENREIAAKGFWFQRSDEEKRQSRYQWGPPNPQALNRYAYCLGNPLRYIDPTGHDQVVTVELTLEELEALIGLIEDLMWYNTGGGVLFTGGGSLLVLASGPVGIPVIVVGIILGVDAVQLGMFAGYLKDNTVQLGITDCDGLLRRITMVS